MQIKKKRPSRTKLRPELLYLLLVVWVVGVYYFYSKMPASTDSTTATTATTKSLPKDQKQRRTSQDPFYGWQPANPSSEGASECKISDCFHGKGTMADHPHCHNLCQDNPQDLENVPEVPLDWIPDAKMLHNMLLDGHDQTGQPWPPPLSKDYCGALGEFGGPNDPSKLLLEQVPIHGLPANDKDGPSIFCGVYTMQVNHAGNVRAMRETWAPHCDGFVAFSTATDPRIPALNIEHEGPEEYNNMWQKSRAIWHYIGSHYLDQFDYFILGGEDLLVIPDNLRAYLKSLQQNPDQEDLFAGRRFKGYGINNYFNSGGAGYVLSRATLRKYYETGYDHPDCNPHRHTAMEDVMLAECLRNVFHIGLTDTRDEQLRERFHPFGPGNHYNWRPTPAGAKKDWYEDYNAEWGLKTGVECCAPDSVSFHYIKKPAMVRHIWSLLYNDHCS